MSEQAAAQLQANKTIVTAFYELAFNERQPQLAAQRYLATDYRQHNAEVADGSDGFVQFASAFAQAHPQLQLQIKRVLAEADFVVLHVHARLTPDERGAVVIDIFRLQHGRIVEHWDAVQPIPQQSMNSSGPF